MVGESTSKKAESSIMIGPSLKRLPQAELYRLWLMSGGAEDDEPEGAGREADTEAVDYRERMMDDIRKKEGRE
jgi:hypothetical protein